MDETRSRFCAHTDPHMTKMLDRYSIMDPEGTRLWLETLDESVNSLFSFWKILRSRVNLDSYMGIVFECDSSRYGEVVVKMYPPFLKERYFRESYIYQKLQNYHQCELLDRVPGKYALLLQRVSPGSYISYPQDAAAIMRLFKDMDKNKVPVSALRDLEPAIQSILHQTKEEYKVSKKYGYHPELMEYLVNKAEEVYEGTFSAEERYLLHGDVYFKNALKGQSSIQIIDPFGYQDAYIFEYMPFFTYELALHSDPRDHLKDSKDLIGFFQEFTDISKFYPAAFVFLVRLIIPSIHESNDQFKRADNYLALIRALYLDEGDRLTLEKTAQ